MSEFLGVEVQPTVAGIVYPRMRDLMLAVHRYAFPGPRVEEEAEASFQTAEFLVRNLGDQASQALGEKPSVYYGSYDIDKLVDSGLLPPSMQGKNIGIQNHTDGVALTHLGGWGVDPRVVKLAEEAGGKYGVAVLHDGVKAVYRFADDGQEVTVPMMAICDTTVKAAGQLGMNGAAVEAALQPFVIPVTSTIRDRGGGHYMDEYSAPATDLGAHYSSGSLQNSIYPDVLAFLGERYISYYKGLVAGHSRVEVAPLRTIPKYQRITHPRHKVEPDGQVVYGIDRQYQRDLEGHVTVELRRPIAFEDLGPDTNALLQATGAMLEQVGNQ